MAVCCVHYFWRKEIIQKRFQAEIIAARVLLQTSFEWIGTGILSSTDFLETPLSKSSFTSLCLHLLSLQPYNSKLGLLWFAVSTSVIDLQFSQRGART